MILKRINYLILMVVFALAGFVYHQHSSEKMINQLDAIFACDQFKVTIPHHGGYAATTFGKGILRIHLQTKDSTYQLRYKDAIDRRKLEFIIDKEEYCQLKNLFAKLIEIHNPTKKLSGNCLTIDHNYILETNHQKLVIKPDKDLSESNCLMNWLYSKELNN